MKVLFYHIMFIFIFCCFSNPVKSQEIPDTLFSAKIMDIDILKHVQIRGRSGFVLNYRFLHIKVKSLNNDSIFVIMKVFNMHDEGLRYANHDDLKIGEIKKFRVFRFEPCQCRLPRVDGYCEDGKFFPLYSSLISSYVSIYRIVAYD